MPCGCFLNNRGFFLPEPIWGEGSGLILIGLVDAHCHFNCLWRMARKRQMATGQQFPVFWTSLGLIIGLPLLASSSPACR